MSFAIETKWVPYLKLEQSNWNFLFIRLVGVKSKLKIFSIFLTTYRLHDFWTDTNHIRQSSFMNEPRNAVVNTDFLLFYKSL